MSGLDEAMRIRRFGTDALKSFHLFIRSFHFVVDFDAMNYSEIGYAGYEFDVELLKGRYTL